MPSKVPPPVPSRHQNERRGVRAGPAVGRKSLDSLAALRCRPACLARCSVADSELIRAPPPSHLSRPLGFSGSACWSMRLAVHRLCCGSWPARIRGHRFHRHPRAAVVPGWTHHHPRDPDCTRTRWRRSVLCNSEPSTSSGSTRGLDAAVRARDGIQPGRNVGQQVLAFRLLSVPGISLIPIAYGLPALSATPLWGGSASFRRSPSFGYFRTVYGA